MNRSSICCTVKLTRAVAPGCAACRAQNSRERSTSSKTSLLPSRLSLACHAIFSTTAHGNFDAVRRSSRRSRRMQIASASLPSRIGTLHDSADDSERERSMHGGKCRTSMGRMSSSGRFACAASYIGAGECRYGTKYRLAKSVAAFDTLDNAFSLCIEINPSRTQQPRKGNCRGTSQRRRHKTGSVEAVG